MWRNAELTDVGLELLSGMLNGGKLTITRAAIGGGVVGSEKLHEQTELTEPIATTVSIAGAKELSDKKGRTIFVRILNNGIVKTARMKQVGIFAKTDSASEVLIAITQDDTGEEIPPYAEFPDFIIEFNFVLAISRTNNITVMTDLSTVATLDAIYKSVEVSENEIPAVGVKTHYYVLKSVSGYVTPSDPPNLAEGVLGIENVGKVPGFVADETNIHQLAVSAK